MAMSDDELEVLAERLADVVEDRARLLVRGEIGKLRDVVDRMPFAHGEFLKQCTSCAFWAVTTSTHCRDCGQPLVIDARRAA